MHLCMRVRMGEKPYCDKDLIISCHLYYCICSFYLGERTNVLNTTIKQVYFLKQRDDTVSYKRYNARQDKTKK